MMIKRGVLILFILIFPFISDADIIRECAVSLKSVQLVIETDTDNPSLETIRPVVDMFLTALVLPQEEFGVNVDLKELTYEVGGEAIKTPAGRVLLEADLTLKRDVEDAFKTLNVSRQFLTLKSKVTAGNIAIYEEGDTAYIGRGELKPDLIISNSALNIEGVRSILWDKLNYGDEYKDLRALYYGIGLARWYKDRHKVNLEGYVDRLNGARAEILDAYFGVVSQHEGGISFQRFGIKPLDKKPRRLPLYERVYCEVDLDTGEVTEFEVVSSPVIVDLPDVLARILSKRNFDDEDMRIAGEIVNKFFPEKEEDTCRTIALLMREAVLNPQAREDEVTQRYKELGIADIHSAVEVIMRSAPVNEVLFLARERLVERRDNVIRLGDKRNIRGLLTYTLLLKHPRNKAVKLLDWPHIAGQIEYKPLSRVIALPDRRGIGGLLSYDRTVPMPSEDKPDALLVWLLNQNDFPQRKDYIAVADNIIEDFYRATPFRRKLGIYYNGNIFKQCMVAWPPCTGGFQPSWPPCNDPVRIENFFQEEKIAVPFLFREMLFAKSLNVSPTILEKYGEPIKSYENGARALIYCIERLQDILGIPEPITDDEHEFLGIYAPEMLDIYPGTFRGGFVANMVYSSHYYNFVINKMHTEFNKRKLYVNEINKEIKKIKEKELYNFNSDLEYKVRGRVFLKFLLTQNKIAEVESEFNRSLALFKPFLLGRINTARINKTARLRGFGRYDVFVFESGEDIVKKLTSRRYRKKMYWQDKNGHELIHKKVNLNMLNGWDTARLLNKRPDLANQVDTDKMGQEEWAWLRTKQKSRQKSWINHIFSSPVHMTNMRMKNPLMRSARMKNALNAQDMRRKSAGGRKAARKDYFVKRDSFVKDEKVEKEPTNVPWRKKKWKKKKEDKRDFWHVFLLWRLEQEDDEEKEAAGFIKPEFTEYGLLEDDYISPGIPVFGLSEYNAGNSSGIMGVPVSYGIDLGLDVEVSGEELVLEDRMAEDEPMSGTDKLEGVPVDCLELIAGVDWGGVSEEEVAYLLEVCPGFRDEILWRRSNGR